MSETISFTIPATYSALSATSRMLADMAEDAAADEQARGMRLKDLCSGLKPECSGVPVAQPEPEPEETADQTGQVDSNGVPFNAEFCSSGDQPFYTSGPKLGQWKKRRGVDEDSYNDWYADNVPAAVANVTKPAPVDSAQAFAAPATEPTPAPAPVPAGPVFQNAGELMAWVSEMQAAGKLKQSDVSAAWTEAGVTINDVFAADAEAVKTACAKMVAVLHPKTVI